MQWMRNREEGIYFFSRIPDTHPMIMRGAKSLPNDRETTDKTTKIWTEYPMMKSGPNQIKRRRRKLRISVISSMINEGR